MSPVEMELFSEKLANTFERSFNEKRAANGLAPISMSAEDRAVIRNIVEETETNPGPVQATSAEREYARQLVSECAEPALA